MATVDMYIESYNPSTGELYLDFINEADVKEFITKFKLDPLDKGVYVPPTMLYIHDCFTKRDIHDEDVLSFDKTAFYDAVKGKIKQSPDMPATVLCEIEGGL